MLPKEKRAYRMSGHGVLDVINTNTQKYTQTSTDTLTSAQITFGGVYIIFAVHLWGWVVHVYMCVSTGVCAELLSVHWGS